MSKKVLTHKALAQKIKNATNIPSDYDEEKELKGITKSELNSWETGGVYNLIVNTSIPNNKVLIDDDVTVSSSYTNILGNCETSYQYISPRAILFRRTNSPKGTKFLVNFCSRNNNTNPEQLGSVIVFNNEGRKVMDSYEWGLTTYTQNYTGDVYVYVEDVYSNENINVRIICSSLSINYFIGNVMRVGGFRDQYNIQGNYPMNFFVPGYEKLAEVLKGTNTSYIGYIRGYMYSGVAEIRVKDGNNYFFGGPDNDGQPGVFSQPKGRLLNRSGDTFAYKGTTKNYHIHFIMSSSVGTGSSDSQTTARVILNGTVLSSNYAKPATSNLVQTDPSTGYRYINFNSYNGAAQFDRYQDILITARSGSDSIQLKRDDVLKFELTAPSRKTHVFRWGMIVLKEV